MYCTKDDFHWCYWDMYYICHNTTDGRADHICTQSHRHNVRLTTHTHTPTCSLASQIYFLQVNIHDKKWAHRQDMAGSQDYHTPLAASKQYCKLIHCSDAIHTKEPCDWTRFNSLRLVSGCYQWTPPCPPPHRGSPPHGLAAHLESVRAVVECKRYTWC